MFDFEKDRFEFMDAGMQILGSFSGSEAIFDAFVIFINVLQRSYKSREIAAIEGSVDEVSKLFKILF